MTGMVLLFRTVFMVFATYLLTQIQEPDIFHLGMALCVTITGLIVTKE